MSSLEQDDAGSTENGSVTRRTRSTRANKSAAPVAPLKSTRSKKVQKPADEPRTNESEEDMKTPQTRKYARTSQTSHPRLIHSELKEAQKYLREALSTFQETIKIQEFQAPPDDCESYGILLAKKLRAFPEIERLEIMYAIDGLIIDRHRSRQPHLFSNITSIPSPTPPRPSSSMSSFSEHLPSEKVHQQDIPIYFEPEIQISEEQNTLTDEPNVLKNEKQSDIISKVYNDA